MNNKESIEIIKRFFVALQFLIDSKQLRGIQTFTNRYGIDKRSFYKSKNNPESDIFQLIWLSHLIVDFGISAEWLMTGKGGMLSKIDTKISEKRTEK